MIEMVHSRKITITKGRMNQIILMISILLCLTSARHARHNEFQSFAPSPPVHIPDTMEEILSIPMLNERKVYASENSILSADELSEFGKVKRTRRTPEEDNVRSKPPDRPQWQRKRENITAVNSSDWHIIKSALSRSSTYMTRSKYLDKLMRLNEAPVPICKSNVSTQTDEELADQGQPNIGDEGDDTELTVFDRTLVYSLMTQSFLYEDCGKPYPRGRVCYGVPSGCVEEEVCRLVVGFRYDRSNPGYVSVNFAGETTHSGFIAFTFSHDRFIGRDLVVYCINAGNLADSEVAVYLAFMEGHQAITQRTRSYYQRNFCPRFGYKRDRMMACSFNIATDVYLDDDSHINIENQPFYFGLSFGHFIDSVPVNDSDYGTLRYQQLVQFSSDPVVLRKALRHPKIIYPRSRALIQVHAIFAVISFIFLIPSGVFVAKYGREAYSYNTDVCVRFQMPAWLRTHVCLSLLSVPFIATSLITILIELDFTWRSFETLPMIHSFAGAFAYLLVFANLVCGYFFDWDEWSDYYEDDMGDEGDAKESEKGTKCELVRSWAHWLIGNLSYLCAVVCVCVSGSLPYGQAPCTVEYFAYVHLSVYVLAHLLMTFETKRLAKVFGDDRPILHQRAIIGPMITWRIEDVTASESVYDFHKMDFWKRRRLAVIYFFIVSLICVFTISVLMLLPVVICRHD